MLNKKEKIILAVSFAVIISGGVAAINKNKMAENFSSIGILNTVYKKNSYRKIKNEIYRKISDRDFRDIADNLSFEKLEVTNDILKEQALVSAINTPNKKEYFKNLFTENPAYEKAQNTYKILNAFNDLETISSDFSAYLTEKFGYVKEDYDINKFKELPNNILQKDKLVKLTVNEELKNIIRKLDYEDINLFNSLAEKNPMLIDILEKKFLKEKTDGSEIDVKGMDEKYFSQELDYEKMEQIYAVSRDITTLGNADESIKDFFRLNLADFDYTKICNYGELYLSDRKNDMAIEKEFAEKEYTLNEPFIKLNPYGRTPLGALVNFKTEFSDNPVKVTIKGIDGGKDYSYTIDKKSEKGIPVVALYPNTNNKVTIKILSKDRSSVLAENTISIQTENLDDRLPVVVIEKDYEELFPGTLEPGMNTASFVTEDESLPFIFDNFGKIRYVFDGTNMGKMIMRKNNDSWLWDNGKTIIKVNSLGKVSGDKIEVKNYEELKVDDDLTKGYTVNHIQTLPKKQNILIVYGFSNTTYSSAVYSEVDEKTREEFFRARIYFNKNKIEENNIIFGERTDISPKNI